MALNLINEIPGTLDLSASELAELTDWPYPLIEDYLNRSQTVSQVVQVIDTDFGSMALQDANNVAITGGALDGVDIGSTTPAVTITTDDLTATEGTITDLTVTTLTVGTINITSLTVENLTVTGDTVLGDSLDDSLTINPGTITWTNNPSHTGDHNFLGRVDVQEELAARRLIEIHEADEPDPQPDMARAFAFDQNGETRLKYITPDGLVSDIARDNNFVVRNNSGANMSKGDVVYVSAQTGNVPDIELAQSDSLSTLPAVAVLAEDIDDGDFGVAIKVGIIESINTSSFNVGDVLYVSPTVAGGLTATRPPHPHLNQPVATVLVSGMGNGSIKVDIEYPEGDELGTRQNTYKIGDGTAGTKTLTFDADTDGSISWNGTILDGNLIVTESEGISSNDNDATIPTSAAVKDLVDTSSVSQAIIAGRIALQI